MLRQQSNTRMRSKHEIQTFRVLKAPRHKGHKPQKPQNKKTRTMIKSITSNVSSQEGRTPDLALYISDITHQSTALLHMTPGVQNASSAPCEPRLLLRTWHAHDALDQKRNSISGPFKGSRTTSTSRADDWKKHNHDCIYATQAAIAPWYVTCLRHATEERNCKSRFLSYLIRHASSYPHNHTRWWISLLPHSFKIIFPHAHSKG